MTLPDASRGVVAFVFARGGSKGLPGKNVKVLADKPLIGWAIEQARAVKRIDRVIVSTDDKEIADVARTFGAETPFLRPIELARDDTPEWLAWQHALEFTRQEAGYLPRVMVSVPATAPLRHTIDIERCLNVFEEGGSDVVLTATESHRSPYFNMVKPNSDGTVSIVIQPERRFNRRQDAPAVYDLCTLAYVCDPKFVMANNGIFDGRVRAVLVPRERAIDIDTPLDFHIARCLINEGAVG